MSDWLEAARNNVESARQTRMLPGWLVLGVVLFDFFLIGFGFRYTREMSVVLSAVVAVVLYLLRLSVVTATLVWACRHYGISGEALGIRPRNLLSDFKWSSRICLLCASIIVAALFAGFVIVRLLGIRLPAPPAFFVQVLCDHYPVAQFLALAFLAGTTLVVLAPLAEELIYRCVFLPALACWMGLLPSVAVTAAVFGMAHVIPSDQFWIPIPEIIGGLIMAAGFSIRWSVIPAMVIHAMGNLFSSTLIFIYVKLFEACPTWFGNPWQSPLSAL